VAALALAHGGCDFATTAKGASAPQAPTAPQPQARLTVFVLPSPVIALKDARDPTSRVARWTVQVIESASVGGALTFVNATLRNAASGAPVEPGFLSMDGAEIRRRTGTDRIPAGGTLVLTQSLAYTSDEPTGTLAVAVQIVDDNGNVVGASVTVGVR
jgi:hypothetical protein